VSANRFYRFARDVASWKLIEDEEKFIFGGPGTVLQMDESVVHFVDPASGCCTNQAEGFWGTMKRFLRQMSV